MSQDVEGKLQSDEPPSWKGACILVGAACFSAFSGFVGTILMARKVDPGEFAKGIQPVTTASNRLIRHESGLRLAGRAFGLATLLTTGLLGGVSLIVWRWSGAVTARDLPTHFRGLFPEEWRVQPTDESTNFRTFDELWSYILSQEKNNDETSTSQR